MFEPSNFSSENIKGLEQDDFQYKEVYFNQPDLDSIGVLFFHLKAGLCNPDTPLNFSKRDVEPHILNDPRILCIEVGGSGQVELGNFDHHGENAPSSSATLQAYQTLKINDSYLGRLVSYINELDTLGLVELTRKRGHVAFPTLSDIIAGIRLKYNDPIMVMKEGVKVLEEITKTQQDPYGTIDGFTEYATIKRKNDEEIEKIKTEIQWNRTNNGLIFGYLESELPGSLGIIYEEGKKKFGDDKIIIGIVFNPQFGSQKVKKYTIGLSLDPDRAKELGINLTAINHKLNLLEDGWGGPPTGTIIGSPKNGSEITKDELLKIIKEEL